MKNNINSLSLSLCGLRGVKRNDLGVSHGEYVPFNKFNIQICFYGIAVIFDTLVSISLLYNITEPQKFTNKWFQSFNFHQRSPA